MLLDTFVDSLPVFNHDLVLNDTINLAYLAARGDGKTAARLYVQYNWPQTPKTLIAVCTSCAQESLEKNLNNDNDFCPQKLMVMHKVAEATWQHIKKNPALFCDLSVPQQIWWWSMLSAFCGCSTLEAWLQDVLSLQESYQLLVSRPESLPTFSTDCSLAHMLRTICDRLHELDLDQLLILVDDADSHKDKDLKAMKQWLRPLLNNRFLFNDSRLIWRFFLPVELEEWLSQTASYRTLRMRLWMASWDKESLKALLEKRLQWASRNEIHSFSALITENPDIDYELISMAEEKMNPFGAPRTLLEIGARMAAFLDRSDGKPGHLGEEILMSREEWQLFQQEIDQWNSQEAKILENEKQVNDVALQKVLYSNFTLDELRQLCFELRIKYEDFEGRTMQAFSRELVEFCRRDGLTEVLVTAVKHFRPTIKLKDIYKNQNNHFTETDIGEEP